MASLAKIPRVLLVEITGSRYALQMVPEYNLQHALTYWSNVIVSQKSSAKRLAGYELDDWHSNPGRGIHPLKPSGNYMHQLL
jgi:hypothetical protein